MNVLKPLGRYDEFCDGRHDMLLDLCLLARDTFPCPLANVMFDIWPHELVCDGLACALHAWMTEPMNHIKDSPSVR